MSPTSTRRLPQLERVVFDADVSAEVEPLLQAVGFRTESMLRLMDVVDIQDDVEVVKWARRHRRILICHDKHKDRVTKIRLNAEVGLHGGRVITVLGGPQQSTYSTVGKILVNRDQWRERLVLRGEHGVVRVGAQNMTFWDQQWLLEHMPRPRALDFDLVLDASRRLRDYAPPKVRRARPKPLRGSKPLL